MKAPRGVLKAGQEGKVLRLKKGLYGLKQAGRGWYLEMSKVFIKELGFTRSAVDHSVFYRRNGETHMIVAVATDDMAVTSKRAVDAIKWFPHGTGNPVFHRSMPVFVEPDIQNEKCAVQRGRWKRFVASSRITS